MPKLHVAFVAGGIGDQLMHFSQMQAFSTLLDGQIDIFCQHAGMIRKIGQHCRWLNEVHDIGRFKKLGRIRQFTTGVKSLSRKNYQNAIVFHPSTSFKTAAFLAGIPTRIGIHQRLLDRVILSQDQPEVDRVTDHQAWGHRPFGMVFDQYLIDKNIDPVGTAPIAPQANLSQEFGDFIARLPRPFIVANLFSADIARRWPTKHAADCLANLVSNHGGTIFLSSGPDAGDWNESFFRHWPGHLARPVDLLHEGKDIRFELELYHTADAYIGVNSFTANLAMNCDLPSVVLYNKKTDFLNYRKNSLGVFPTRGTEMGSIKQADVAEAFARLDKAPATDQPLPV